MGMRDNKRVSKHPQLIMGFVVKILLKSRQEFCIIFVLFASEVIGGVVLTSHMCKKWKNLSLKPLSQDSEDISLEECEDDVGMFEGSSDMLSDFLSAGDKFVVNAEADNEEGVEFYLLKCIQTKWKLRKICERQVE